MVRVVVAAVLVSLGLCSVGCAGKSVGEEDLDDGSGMTSGGKGGGVPAPTTSPPKQCESYVDTWCTKSFGCYVEVGRLDKGSLKHNVDMCKKLLIDNLPCSAVQSVGSSYPTCVSQVKAMACSKWDVPQDKFATIPAPASCDDALSF